ncbi:unnamed protein product [Closterium sp. NIES-65]|nr:unnamed protein product [Closterium sp. NIES-65]
MAFLPDSSSTVVRRQWPFNSQSTAAARPWTSPRPVLPQPSPPGSASTMDEPSSSSEAPRPPLPRVAVPTFPESMRPQGQTKRNADGETPSPRHRMTKKVRHGITVKEKLHWLKMQDAQPDLGNRALAKLTKVQPCQIRDWKKLRERLEVASSCRRRLVGVVVRAKEKGWMDESLVQDWITQDKGEVEVLDDVNDLVDDEVVVNPFYAEAPVPPKELQAAEEDDAAEEAAEAVEEEWNAPEEGGEAGECNDDDDDWWRPGRYDGEECEEWNAGADVEEE